MEYTLSCLVHLDSGATSPHVCTVRRQVSPNLPPLSFSTALVFGKLPDLGLAHTLVMSIPSQLQSLLTPGVTDLLVSGPKSAQVDRGNGLEAIAVDFGTEQQLRRLAIDLALESGARVDIVNPIADFSNGNLRCQVVLPFGVSRQTLISIRRHPSQQVTLQHLLEAEMLSEAQAGYLRAAVEDKKTILIVGSTGTGKTTLLSALIHLAQQRTICIEQTPEIHPSFPAVELQPGCITVPHWPASPANMPGHIALKQIYIAR